MIDLTPGWQVALEAVGWAGSAVVVWSMMQQRILRLRLYNLVGCLVQILYNGVLGVWPLVTLNVVLAAIQVVNLRRLLRGRDDPTSYAVAEVPADGPLVAHLLGEHRQDVVRFQPGFERPSRDAEAYLVLSGDEVIGCVVVHDAGDGVAQIELDYVTEKYRDFTPGQFVFHRSGVLAARGYRAVASAPDTVDPYYGQIGFERRGDRYVLELGTA